MTNVQNGVPETRETSSVRLVGTLARETSRLFNEANLWLDEHHGCVTRTRTTSGEHVVVVLSTGVSAQFIADAPGDYEEGIVLAIDELRARS